MEYKIYTSAVLNPVEQARADYSICGITTTVNSKQHRISHLRLGIAKRASRTILLKKFLNNPSQPKISNGNQQ